MNGRVMPVSGRIRTTPPMIRNVWRPSAKVNPAASSFLVSKEVFGGDYRVEIELTFGRGRYIGVYLDFSQDTQSGTWMASGHALEQDAPDNEIERGYIKTVERGAWIVRATGALPIEQGQRLTLAFSRSGDDYMLWHDSQLIAIYHKTGGYPAGPLQLRLTNSAVRIHRLQVHTSE